MNDLRTALDEALAKYYENTHMLEGLAWQEAQEGAMKKLNEVYEKREQDKGADKNELEAFKGAYDQAKADARAEKTKLDGFRDDAAKAKKVLDKATAALEEDPNNQDLIDAKNAAQGDFDTKDGKIADQVTLWEEKEGEIQGKLDEFNEKQAEKADSREQAVVDETAWILYGKPAEGEEKAVEGLIEKVRKAEKAANQANLALAQAEKALANNKDEEAVKGLVEAVRAAQDSTYVKI